MTVQENKNIIRQFIKNEKIIDSPLGAIEIKECIGQGGNAIVLNAQFGKNEVALKFLAEEEGSSKYKRFLTEFREIIQLAETKAVVPIYYFGHLGIGEQRFPYILMKKYPYTLESWSAAHPVSDFNTLKGILKNLLDIISVIHENNIVHRDLKPENILVSDNGEMVLADFGISWFDPDFYERFVHTRKGDRMANFDFSAPEQFLKGSVPHPTMDIFALGQIITWLVTGGVARGNRPPLTAIDMSFSVIEPTISKMLSRSPEDRPQSINEVRDNIIHTISEMDEGRRRQEEINSVINNLEIYDDVLRDCFPGKRGLVETDDEKKVERILSELNEAAQKIDLSWCQGRASLPINKIIRLNDDTWIMDFTEIQIEKMWVFKDNYSMDHEFILMKTKAMPNFDIYDNDATYRDEAAWFLDRYISREEYDDGFAEIDGESVRLKGRAELRVRDLQPQYYFITTSSHPIYLSENESIVTDIYRNLMERDELGEEDIERLRRLRRHEISIMMN